MGKRGHGSSDRLSGAVGDARAEATDHPLTSDGGRCPASEPEGSTDQMLRRAPLRHNMPGVVHLGRHLARRKRHVSEILNSNRGSIDARARLHDLLGSFLWCNPELRSGLLNNSGCFQQRRLKRDFSACPVVPDCAWTLSGLLLVRCGGRVEVDPSPRSP